jgi:hypothetical protein
MEDKPDATPDQAVTALVEQLLLVTSPLQSIINHMFEFEAAGRSAPDAPPPEVVLAGLLEGVLGGLVERHGRRQVEAAAAILQDAGETICSEFYLVDVDEDEPGTGANGVPPPPAAA